MNVIQAFILGIVQGLTEFLPVSSSGHLVLFEKLFGLHSDSITFEVALHFATLLAVVTFMWKDIVEILKKPFGKLPIMIVVGTIPTVLIGFLFKDFIESTFKGGRTLGLEFIITGLVLLYAENTRSKNKNKGLKEMNYLDATVIGTAQGIAIMPAISRSGLTIAGGLFRGLNREFVLKYSFLMSIPAILGSVVLDGVDIIKGSGLGIDVMPLVIGMVAAAISGYLAIRFMMKIFSKASFKIFSYYVFILGGIIVIEQIFSGRMFGRLF